MSSAITQDEHTLRTSNEHWAQMARKFISANNNNNSFCKALFLKEKLNRGNHFVLISVLNLNNSNNNSFTCSSNNKA